MRSLGKTLIAALVATIVTCTIVVAFGRPDTTLGGLLGDSDSSTSAGPSAEGDGSSPAEQAGADGQLPWGPTPEELADARELVRGWTPEQLAGQVIVGRYRGVDPQEPADLVKRLHLAGMAITSDNVVDTDQLKQMTAAISAAVKADGRDFPAVIGADQEGGTTQHLGETAADFPPFEQDGRAVADGHPELVRAGAKAAALEMRGLGLTWVLAPVADVTIGPEDPTIGSRSASQDPKIAAQATVEAVTGYDEAGLVATVKHFPGHGSVTTDSHESMPVQDRSLQTLKEVDLVPFKAAIEAGATAVMMSHIDVLSMAPGEPASLANSAYTYLRDEMDFGGVMVTDSLGMGAVTSTQRPVVRAMLAGADLLLMPADTETAHTSLVQAIESGTLPRERVEDAAAKVIALQRWQARIAAKVPVPADAADQAAAAAEALDNVS